VEVVNDNLIATLEKAFKQEQDTLYAAKQAAYMRNQFPFFGLSKPKRTLIQAKICTDLRFSSEDELLSTISYLWQKEQREFQYVALDIAYKQRTLLSLASISILEQLIRTKSWWDTVDPLAYNLVGHVMKQNPSGLSLMDTWIKDPYLWIARSALIFQLKWKQDTDNTRLFAYCKYQAQHTDFFIRKAIGWSLRQYSKTDKAAVYSFIKDNKHMLSALSIKKGSIYLKG
jgi:3-methyladenine DNA glycosylase AlkD